MAYKGRYSPINKERISKRHPTNVIYRSLWERKFMKWCDLSESVIKWGSEETVVPYVSPLDNKIHRYFIDFYVQLRDKDGILKSYLVEPNLRSIQNPQKLIQSERLEHGSLKSKIGVSMKQSGKRQRSLLKIRPTTVHNSNRRPLKLA